VRACACARKCVHGRVRYARDGSYIQHQLELPKRLESEGMTTDSSKTPPDIPNPADLSVSSSSLPTVVPHSLALAPVVCVFVSACVSVCVSAALPFCLECLSEKDPPAPAIGPGGDSCELAEGGDDCGTYECYSTTNLAHTNMTQALMINAPALRMHERASRTRIPPCAAAERALTRV